ncbi:dihydroorotase [Flavobacterium croceum]|uniref:Dihydroorotase n=1 Tax=Flavobacterium croceum DSM 17960 TaxID=1121886 RepID=A0A2S4NBC4_9FLAO|nr:dihydroorotase [Flavobacterium croceum]POS02753.1 dihydroorotase [Flavobacterium croceum DSM 17960]
MKLILKKAKVLDASSQYHKQTVDIKITKGIIEDIAPEITQNDYQNIEFDNLHISNGWIDTSVCFGEPGFEDAETLLNGLNTAAKSGFTQVAIQPNTKPITDNQAQIEFIKNRSLHHLVEAFPIGALTKKSEGLDLADLYDMKNAGAVAFGDYNCSIANANIMKIALQYVQDFNGLVIAFSQEDSLKGKGVVNEGVAATHLGLKGIPSLAEEIAIARNLFLLEYTGGKLHIPTISTQKSVKLIQEAKAKGLHVTCSVSVHHLTLTDEKLSDFNTNTKVLPPLRTEQDRLALLEAVKDNTIDCITTDHHPVNIEYKNLEFDLAHFGTIGLESAFGALNKVLTLECIIEKLTFGRTILGKQKSSIKQGNLANMTLFNPNTSWVFDTKNIISKSKNAIFINEPMQGEVYGVINNNKISLNNNERK